MRLAEGYFHGTKVWPTAEPSNINGEKLYIFRETTPMILDEPNEAIVRMAKALIVRSLEDYMLVLSSSSMDSYLRSKLAYEVMEFFDSEFYDLLSEIVPELKLNRREKEWILRNMSDVYSRYCPFWRR